MNEIREICVKKLSKPGQDMKRSNAMWDKRAREFGRLSLRAGGDAVFDFFRAKAPLKGRSVLDVGCGAGRYLKRFLDEGAAAEGVEPSAGMIGQARDYLSRSGYDGAAAKIHNVAFQDFSPGKKYDYVFLANSPAISYYENYAKIVALARQGIFVSSWLRIEDRFLEKVALALGREPNTHGGYDIIYFMNLLLADGYYPEFSTIVARREERTAPENFCQRYASWLYGPEYSEGELRLVEKEIGRHLEEDGTVLASGTRVMGMLFLDLRRQEGAEKA